MFTRCAFWLLVTGVQVQILGFDSWKRRLGEGIPGEICPVPVGSSRFSREVIRMVQGVNHLLFNRCTCLTLGLVAQRLLCRYGIPSSLVLGVNVSGGGKETFEAHAWVWVEGQIRLGQHNGCYTALVSYLR